MALLYKEPGDETVKKLKCGNMGKVVKLLVKSGSSVRPGEAVLEFTPGCFNPIIMKVQRLENLLNIPPIYLILISGHVRQLRG